MAYEILVSRTPHLESQPRSSWPWATFSLLLPAIVIDLIHFLSQNVMHGLSHITYHVFHTYTLLYLVMRTPMYAISPPMVIFPYCQSWHPKKHEKVRSSLTPSLFCMDQLFVSFLLPLPSSPRFVSSLRFCISLPFLAILVARWECCRAHERFVLSAGRVSKQAVSSRCLLCLDDLCLVAVEQLHWNQSLAECFSPISSFTISRRYISHRASMSNSWRVDSIHINVGNSDCAIHLLVEDALPTV